MLFFGILVVMFAAIFDVIGKNENEDFRHVGAYTGGILWTLRLSLGDFGFGVLEGKKIEHERTLLILDRLVCCCSSFQSCIFKFHHC
jgi:hypothetical protein